jgi:hypothetical protein
MTGDVRDIRVVYHFERQVVIPDGMIVLGTNLHFSYVFCYMS